ncbi:hypothetical protein SAMN04490355_103237 [Pelosinus propionicus DSM 13327]|uniref:Uncharacterized protein n=1 Tax=Pelosinus propionicus DSM 13327 TaxID=1123291 RepID=A0A1I4MD03_9FIRM|nr:hypothetical protein SAMN04490355_103237 [Pelosinus propionicus DSM 13327]
MGVDIEKHLCGTVAQAILGVFDANAVCREAAGVIVPEFVKGDIKARRFGQTLKSFGPVARVLEFAEGVGEYHVVILPGLAAGFAGGDGCRLACLVPLDLKYRDFWQWQDALAGGGFSVVEFQAVVGDDDGPLDADAVGGEFEVYPLQSQQFGAADAGGPF